MMKIKSFFIIINVIKPDQLTVGDNISYRISKFLYLTLDTKNKIVMLKQPSLY